MPPVSSGYTVDTKDTRFKKLLTVEDHKAEAGCHQGARENGKGEQVGLLARGTLSIMSLQRASL